MRQTRGGSFRPDAAGSERDRGARASDVAPTKRGTGSGRRHYSDRFFWGGGNDTLAQQKRVVVIGMPEGMSAWPRALRELQYLADSTNHTVTIPCVNLSDGRCYTCKSTDTTSFTDLFDLSSWGLTPFDAELDSDPDVEFSMCGLSGCSQDEVGPNTIEGWTEAVSSVPSVGVHALSAGRLHIHHDQLNSTLGNDLGPSTRNGARMDPAQWSQWTDTWPQFNFSAAREAEVERILAANGLRPAAGGRAGNYVVYHWRSENVADINYTYCAQELVSHLDAQQDESAKRLVLVSDMPFNASAMPSLWGSDAAKIGRDPTLPAAREMLLDAGFTKIEILAAKAGYDLRSVPKIHVSIWDAIIARGGEKLLLCRATECAPCTRADSKFLSLLRHHFLQHHGPRASVEESWMTSGASTVERRGPAEAR